MNDNAERLTQAEEQRGRLLRALKRCDALFLEVYSNAQKLPWQDIEQLGKAGLDATAAALTPSAPAEPAVEGGIKCKMLSTIDGTHMAEWECPKCSALYASPRAVYCKCEPPQRAEGAELPVRSAWRCIDCDKDLVFSCRELGTGLCHPCAHKRYASVKPDAELRAECNGSCDIALARRQVGPDGVVPGNARECAELWEREASRLRASVSEWQARWKILASQSEATITALRSEVERLKGAIAEIPTLIRARNDYRPGCDAHTALESLARIIELTPPTTGEQHG